MFDLYNHMFDLYLVTLKPDHFITQKLRTYITHKDVHVHAYTYIYIYMYLLTCIHKCIHTKIMLIHLHTHKDTYHANRMRMQI
jgi:hypothetical protein